MEKIIFLLWKDETRSDEQFRNDLLEKMPRQIMDNAVVAGLTINIDDDRVKKAHEKRMVAVDKAMNASVSVWLDCIQQKLQIDSVIANYCQKYSSYLVTESVPLKNTEHLSKPGEATTGMNHIVLLQKPEHLSRSQWLDIWQNSHTQIAIDTQSTFQYIQNVVVRPLDSECPRVDAIVEESFPEPAMTDIEAFYDAVGDKEKLKKNATDMFESISRFIELDKLTVIPMSEYV
ncbi:MAG: EthD domain-containing protein, partial [Pseudomonadales bacterium]|nr:EthD domain-containing protein [Pseudomonadales bacterium]